MKKLILLILPFVSILFSNFVIAAPNIQVPENTDSNSSSTSSDNSSTSSDDCVKLNTDIP